MNLGQVTLDTKSLILTKLNRGTPLRIAQYRVTQFVLGDHLVYN